MGPALLYDDDLIRVIWHPGPSDHVLITFGDLVGLAQGTRFFADKPVARTGLACIGFMPKSGHWYPAGSMAPAMAACADVLGRYTRRVGYGASMGGYAVIKYARALGMTEVLSLCPQWSIDPAECDGTDPGWGAHFTPSMAGMGIRRDEAAGRIFLFSDHKHAKDRFHADRIAAHCDDVRRITVPHVGHHVTPTLAGTAVLTRMIKACLADDCAELGRIVRPARRFTAPRVNNVLTAAAARHPALATEFLRGLELDSPYVPLIDRNLIARVSGGALRSPIAHVTALLDRMSRPLHQALRLERQGVAESGVTTSWGTQLVYDAGANLCRHRSHLAPGERPVRLRMAGPDARLFVAIAGVPFDVCLDAGGRLVLQDEAAPAAAFTIGTGHAGTFTLRAGDRYLSAASGGAVICNRAAAQGWECFTLAPALRP